jgi:hypothetical protein
MIVIDNIPDGAKIEWITDTLKRAFGNDVRVRQCGVSMEDVA